MKVVCSIETLNPTKASAEAHVSFIWWKQNETIQKLLRILLFSSNIRFLQKISETRCCWNHVQLIFISKRYSTCEHSHCTDDTLAHNTTLAKLLKVFHSVCDMLSFTSIAFLCASRTMRLIRTASSEWQLLSIDGFYSLWQTFKRAHVHYYSLISGFTSMIADVRSDFQSRSKKGSARQYVVSHIRLLKNFISIRNNLELFISSHLCA